jgi:hypothetical protein
MAPMNKGIGIRICNACFFLSLLFLLSNGCTTSQPTPAVDSHLEKYRKVYLLQPKEDPGKVMPRILSRLRLAGFEVSEISSERLKALAKDVREKGLSEPTVVCVVDYVSISDYKFDDLNYFQSIHIEFVDLKTGDLVFKVGKYKYNSVLPENTQLNRLFIQINDAFFPGQPNPFRDKK